jgi:large subunit ribosomal protein L6
MKQEIIEKIEIPEGMEVSVEGRRVIVSSGDKKIEKGFDMKNIDVAVKGKEIIVGSKKASKKEGKMIGTIKAHINNMIKGVQEGFEYKLAIEFVHFPMNVEVDKGKKEIVIKNFLGEKKNRVGKMIDGAEIEIKGKEITVKSHDKEIAGQAAANLEKLTRVKGKDRRKFQDGIYMVEKAGRKI